MKAVRPDKARSHRSSPRRAWGQALSLGIVLALAHGGLTACRKKKGSDSPAEDTVAAPAPAATSTSTSTSTAKKATPSATAAAAVITVNSPVVVQTGSLALGLTATKGPKPARVYFYSIKDKKRLKPVASDDVNDKGKAGVSLPPGSYVQVVKDNKGKTVPHGTSFVKVPKKKAKAGLHLDDGADTLVSVPSATADVAMQLLDSMLAKNTTMAADENPVVNLTLLQSLAGPIAAQQKKGKAVDDKLLGEIAAQADASTQALSKSLSAKGKDPGATFEDMAAGAEDSKSQALCNGADCAAALNKAANDKLLAALGGDANAAALVGKNADAAGVYAACPGDVASAMDSALLESQLIGYLQPLGVDPATGKSSYDAADKALLVAVAVNGGVSKVETFLTQLQAIATAADASKLSAQSDNLLAALTAAAQGKYSLAKADVAAANGALKKADKKNANAAVAGYKQIFTDYGTAVAGAAAFAADADAAGAAASTDALAKTDGSATGFSPGGDCALIGATPIDDIVVGVASWPGFCFADPSLSCNSIKPYLSDSPTPADANSPTKTCDYSLFNGVDKCAKFGGYNADQRQSITATALAASNNAAVSPFCAEQDAATPCSAIGLAVNAGGDATKCDLTPPPAYAAQFANIGDSCDKLISDILNLSDQNALTAKLTGVTLGTALCTAFTAPADGYPDSCETAGGLLDVPFGTDAATNNCTFNPPPPPKADFLVGGDCATVAALDPANFGLYVAQLSTTAPLFCTNFTATSAVADCSKFSNSSDTTALQLKAQGANCVLDDGGFNLKDSCASFDALAAKSTAVQNLIIAGANPGDLICSNLAGSSKADCPTLFNGLVAKDSGCGLPKPDFTVGGACGAGGAVNTALAASPGVFVAQLAPPDNLVLCTGASLAGITDCASLDPTLTLNSAKDTCEITAPTTSFSLGGECSTVPTTTMSGYVDKLGPASPTLCTNFTASAAYTLCSDIDPRLTLIGANCGIDYPTYTLGGSCSDFANLPPAVQQYVLDSQAPTAVQAASAAVIVCTDVGSSSYLTCDNVVVNTGSITSSPANALSAQDSGGGLTACILPKPAMSP